VGGLGRQAEKQRAQKRVIQIHDSTIGIGAVLDKQNPLHRPLSRFGIGIAAPEWIAAPPRP
jgi:hypothetical protein